MENTTTLTKEVQVTYSKNKIQVKSKDKNKFIPRFISAIVLLTLVSLCYLDIDWIKLISRIPDVGNVFWKLAHFKFDKMDLIFEALLETISIATLSLIYSLVLGIIFGMLGSRNIIKAKGVAVFVQSIFTFLRAVPTPIWVLLMLVCLGMGSEAGVAGLCVHTTAFFTKSFAQSFEDIPTETLEALEATGTNKLSVFINAVLPASFAQIIAWVGMRLETNFSECAILGMVGAGGVGFIISRNLQNYDYGTAGVAIFLVFVVAYLIERLFVAIKKKLAQ